ncbi:uncharacterized protein LOC121974755 [Zingiber officinale]|uniref:uncharacterized protein LOC121974755 n=1 Tax=Zingiber officinale TaxID=94328 RepID=UPI001C4D44A6|nr:uncharacterized protein LOC121974755 [Zingiber officinale]
MARVSAVEWARGGGGCCCSFKRIAFMICCVNLVAALLVVRSLYTSFFFPPSSGISGNSLADQIMRTEESIRIRGEMEPLALVSAVRKLKKKLSGDQKRGLIQLPQPVMYKFAYEILERLQGLHNTNVTEQQAAVNLWRIQKLEVVRKEASSKSSNSSIRYQEAMWFIEMLKQALVTNWHVLMEGIGFWIAANVMNTEHDDKPENETDIEEIIPGRPMAPECHAELHTEGADLLDPKFLKPHIPYKILPHVQSACTRRRTKKPQKP